MSKYRPPNKGFWKGRATAADAGDLYWYQNIFLLDLNELVTLPGSGINIALLGYDCDEGVARNQGRTGAVSGSEKIKYQLAKLAFHHGNIKVYDAGSIHCEDNNLESTQDELAQLIEKLLNISFFPIVLGGGHDLAYGHGKGILNYLSDKNGKKLGIINIDAHFDLRAVSTSANSGTPFRQLSDFCQKLNMDFHYAVIGIQKESNTSDLFGVADRLNTRFWLAEEFWNTQKSTIQKEVLSFTEQLDYLYLTIDMDGFSSAFAPGVSAPSPLGLHPDVVINILKAVIRTGKVISLDIAELNPLYDRDDMTARLASRIIDRICSYLAEI